MQDLIGVGHGKEKMECIFSCHQFNINMEKKESKTSKHFWFSMIKSFLRFVGFFVLAYQDFVGAAVLLSAAEILGIVEEL